MLDMQPTHKLRSTARHIGGLAIFGMFAACVGCGESPSSESGTNVGAQPAVAVSSPQDEMISKERSLQAEKDDLQSTRFANNLTGRLNAADIDDQISALESELSKLYASAPIAEHWKGEIFYMGRENDMVILRAGHGARHTYEMKLFDPEAKKLAEQLSNKMEISFSGSIGRETSATLTGALLAPQFSFYPTNISYGDLVITQSAEQIAQLTAEEQAIAELAEEDASNRSQVKQLCRQTVVDGLKYPASASFGFFRDEIEKVNNKRWTYRGVVDANNDFGGTLSIRFVCTGNIKKNNISVRVDLLD